MESNKNQESSKYNDFLQADIGALSRWLAQEDNSEDSYIVRISSIAARRLLSQYIKPYIVYSSEADVAYMSTPTPNYGFCLNKNNQLHIDLVIEVIQELQRMAEINDLEYSFSLPSYGIVDIVPQEQSWLLDSNTGDMPRAESLIESPQPNDVLTEINTDLEEAISKEESTLSDTHIGGNISINIHVYKNYLSKIQQILSNNPPKDSNKKTFDVYQIFAPKYWQDIKKTLSLSESDTHKISYNELLFVQQYIVLLIKELHIDLARIKRETAIRSLALKDIQQELEDAHDTNLQLAKSLADILLINLGDDEYLLEYFPAIKKSLIYIINECNYDAIRFKPEECISRGSCTTDEMMKMIQLLRFFKKEEKET